MGNAFLLDGRRPFSFSGKKMGGVVLRRACRIPSAPVRKSSCNLVTNCNFYAPHLYKANDFRYNISVLQKTKQPSLLLPMGGMMKAIKRITALALCALMLLGLLSGCGEKNKGTRNSS